MHVWKKVSRPPAHLYANWSGDIFFNPFALRTEFFCEMHPSNTVPTKIMGSGFSCGTTIETGLSTDMIWRVKLIQSC
jgi:hypothetical protein